MDEAKRKELRELCEKATPGPWRMHDAEAVTIVAGKPGIPIGLFAPCSRTAQENEANARFALHARTALPLLLDALDEAEKALSEKGEYGYSQQVVDVLTKERNGLQARLDEAEKPCQWIGEHRRHTGVLEYASDCGWTTTERSLFCPNCGHRVEGAK